MAIDPKRAAMLIIAAKKKPQGSDDSDSMDGSAEPSEGQISAMQDLMDAFKAEDPKAACKAWMALCDMDDESGSES